MADDNSVPKGPPDFMSNLAQSSTAIHEWCQSLMDAGFTDNQALYFIACVIAKTAGETDG